MWKPIFAYGGLALFVAYFGARAIYVLMYGSAEALKGLGL